MEKKILLEFKNHIFYCLYFHVCSVGTEEPQIFLWLWQMLPVLPHVLLLFPLRYIPAYSPSHLYHFTMSFLLPLCSYHLGISPSFLWALPLQHRCASQRAYTCLFVCLSV